MVTKPFFIYHGYMFGSRKKTLIVLSLMFGFVLPLQADTPYTQQSVQEEFAEYMAKVRSRIQDFWVVPQVMEEGHTVVVFKVDRNGNILSSDIKQSSGNEVFDGSALEALNKAAPFGEFPSNSNRYCITVMYSFDSSIVDTTKMKEYVENSEKYMNIDKRVALEYIDKALKEIEGNPASYFLYARRYKINKSLGNMEAAKNDLAKCKEYKTAYDNNRIHICKMALENEQSPFGYFSLASAYDSAGDYKNAISAIDQAISMTPLNHAYKRYRAEIIMRSSEQ